MSSIEHRVVMAKRRLAEIDIPEGCRGEVEYIAGRVIRDAEPFPGELYNCGGLLPDLQIVIMRKKLATADLHDEVRERIEAVLAEEIRAQYPSFAF
jgi:hypothetical protein